MREWFPQDRAMVASVEEYSECICEHPSIGVYLDFATVRGQDLNIPTE